MKPKVLTLTQEQLDAYQQQNGKIERIQNAPKTALLKRRQVILEDLGFKNYNQYLKSDLWKTIRERVLERDGRVCKGRAHAMMLQLASPDEAAQFTELHVHHYRYDRDTLLGENIDDLITLCSKCHGVRHDIGKSRKEREEKMGIRNQGVFLGRFNDVIRHRPYQDARERERVQEDEAVKSMTAERQERLKVVKSNPPTPNQGETFITCPECQRQLDPKHWRHHMSWHMFSEFPRYGVGLSYEEFVAHEKRQHQHTSQLPRRPKKSSKMKTKRGLVVAPSSTYIKTR